MVLDDYDFLRKKINYSALKYRRTEFENLLFVTGSHLQDLKD
jgi:hypothetical protein